MHTQDRGEELGFMKRWMLVLSRNLDPYKNHKKVNGININELIKQAYLYNGIEAYALNMQV